MLEFIANSTNSMVLVGTFGGALLIGSKRKYRFLIKNYLDKGTGNAWAGHNNVTLELISVLKPLTLSRVGNFGGTLPTGSIHKHTNRLKKKIKYRFYLNIGTGKAWAMQSNVQLSFIEASVISIIFQANFGAALPIGSKEK